ncbi:hypothetical protein B0H14DRAFT_3014768 [Mycena olivaceomarginata]|nr:hypothetical protein B0H14DRAFT_3014768 [Mycena olivaceomarginata]
MHNWVAEFARWAPGVGCFFLCFLCAGFFCSDSGARFWSEFAARWSWERCVGGSRPETETLSVWVLLWGASSRGIGEERVCFS